MPYSVAPHRANLLLQMLLQANVYVSVVWAMSFLIHLLIRINHLWNWDGLTLLVAYLLAVSAEFMRLYAGYSVNLCSGATAMWLLLTVTPCILLPAMVFLRLAVAGRGLWLRIISNAVFALIALEVMVALVHFVFCKPFRSQKSNLPGVLVRLERKMNEEKELPLELPEEYLPEEQLSPSSSEQRRRARRSPESK
ncbi:uncharacterized protein Dana_GF21905 [Drosophila ananassae]|uniref:Transmembrane protein 17B n=1 Tax=Drosophila ananassae TaxID=7217 RepID=B3MZ41_DROAN|nr:uncharacterized protein LOC6504575 [Drosophila ananassae]EDV32885.1 uncharacterized protein Dana_GF21905 [Drosophila ananassae]